MGIQGLMSYVMEHQEFFVDLQLRNTDVIIDGNNLYHRLYFDSDLDMRHGGDYNSFTDIILMNGNDYINLPAIEKFFSKVHLPIGSSRQKGRKHTRIQGLLNWLSRFADPAEAVENVLTYLKKHEKEETRQFLSTFMEEYEPSSVNLKDFFQHGIYEAEEAKKLELPQWILTALAKGLLAPFISDALVLRRTILHAQVENMQRPSAHSAALPIRQVIYRLLLNASQHSLSTSPGKQPTRSAPVFHEFDRSQKALKKSLVQVAALSEKCCDRYSLATLNEVSMSDRQLLFLETLGVTASMLEPIPCLLKLPVAVTCYWAQHSEPKIKLPHMKALLLGVVFGELDKILHSSDSEVPHLEINKIVYEQFLEWGKKSPKEAFELDTAHIFCQWQCCLQMGLYLNQLLCTPLPEPDLTRLYNGTLVHRLHHQLKSGATPENLLSTSPRMYQLYCNMVHVVKDAMPLGFFQKKSKSQRKKKQACYLISSMEKR